MELTTSTLQKQIEKMALARLEEDFHAMVKVLENLPLLRQSSAYHILVKVRRLDKDNVPGSWEEAKTQSVRAYLLDQQMWYEVKKAYLTKYIEEETVSFIKKVGELQTQVDQLGYEVQSIRN